jgi:hypothetical protein
MPTSFISPTPELTITKQGLDFTQEINALMMLFLMTYIS